MANHRDNDPQALFDLYRLASEADFHSSRVWCEAARYVREGKLTTKAAAKQLGVSEATYFRNVKKWNEHAAQGNGVGQ